ncbi:VWA domain-containing protein [Rossellomorea sp. KS-H15a]|uniref:vWA domain-containing protein n=1 Tax=Rossellomorea sp. KS-H15a TaxID=2963940 RepID=UPI0020C5FA30|nr:vWA domain-containing protein [Rossellomorea sp. KS-H15a]UTE76509.1 VWA domain-containing protein [Rossellomorea sp. KS-H15a]
MRIQPKVPFLFILFLTLLMSPTISFAKGNADLHVDFNVTPSQSVIVKPAEGNAKASLDFNIIPAGEVKEAKRPPIDVVFIFDKSGSMNSTRDKMQNAKDGLTSAVQFFEKNKQENDRFSLITFSSEIETILPLNDDLDSIKTSMLHTTAYGGTNYTDPLRAAKHMLRDSNNEKYIVFLTDGQPMIATAVEKVKKEECTRPFWFFCGETDLVENDQQVIYDFQNRYSYNRWLHKIYSPDTSKLKSLWIPSDFSMDGTSLKSGWYNPGELETNSQQMQALIKQKGLEVSKELYNSNITMHTLGYGEGDLDDRYLQMLADQTSGSFIKASEGSVSDAFEKLANKINSVKLEGEAAVPLPANATVDRNVYKVVNNTVYLPFSTVYEVGQGAPSPITLSLPVEFTTKGTYTFNPLKIQYKTAEETAWRNTNNKSVTIQVKDDAPASVTGKLELNKINQELFNLIIEQGKDTNSFTGKYQLEFGGLVNPNAKGNVSDITIYQPLPEGVEVEAGNNLSIENVNGQRTAVMRLTQRINFENGKFSQTSLSTNMKIKAVWAINNVKMPQPKVSYVDSRYGTAVVSNLTPDQNELSAKVRTRKYDNQKEYAYDGFANGTIKKVLITGQGETTVAVLEPGINNGFANKAVKELVADSTQLTITYKDGSTSVLSFIPALTVKDAVTNKVLEDGDSISNQAEFYLSTGVPGNDVKYQYRMLNEDEVIEGWNNIDLQEMKTLDTFGKNEVQVKASGGFAVDDYIIGKTIWIEGDELIRVPSLIELYVGETKSFDVDVFPFGKPNNNYNVLVTQGNDGVINSEYTQVRSTKENRMTGLSPGEDNVIVETKNGKFKKTIRVIVKSKFIDLESMDFTKSKYTLLLEGNDFDVHSNLIFNPHNATNKNIKTVTDTGNGIVEITRENDIWKITPKSKGVTTITVTSDENPDIKATAIFEVVTEEGGNPGTETGSIDGRW